VDFLKEIIAEFYYWDYSEYSQTAMVSHPEVRAEELAKIARQFNVRIEARSVLASYFSLGRIGWRSPNYRRVEILVYGARYEDVKACIGRILLRYGRPDEIPRKIFGTKRLGKRIIDELLSEFNNLR
jgi:hypothetical protein